MKNFQQQCSRKVITGSLDDLQHAVMFLNFRTNNVDPDQTAPRGTVWLG